MSATRNEDTLQLWGDEWSSVRSAAPHRFSYSQGRQVPRSCPSLKRTPRHVLVSAHILKLVLVVQVVNQRPPWKIACSRLSSIKHLSNSPRVKKPITEQKSNLNFNEITILSIYHIKISLSLNKVHSSHCACAPNWYVSISKFVYVEIDWITVIVLVRPFDHFPDLQSTFTHSKLSHSFTSCFHFHPGWFYPLPFHHFPPPKTSPLIRNACLFSPCQRRSQLNWKLCFLLSFSTLPCQSCIRFVVTTAGRSSAEKCSPHCASQNSMRYCLQNKLSHWKSAETSPRLWQMKSLIVFDTPLKLLLKDVVLFYVVHKLCRKQYSNRFSMLSIFVTNLLHPPLAILFYN